MHCGILFYIMRKQTPEFSKNQKKIHFYFKYLIFNEKKTRNVSNQYTKQTL